MKSRTVWAVIAAGIVVVLAGRFAGSKAAVPPAPAPAHQHEHEEAPARPEQPAHEHEGAPAGPEQPTPEQIERLQEALLPQWERELVDLAEALERTGSESAERARGGIGGLDGHMRRGTPEAKAQAQVALLAATRHKDPEVVRDACWVLQYGTGPAVVSRIHELAGHSNPQISAKATEVLAILSANSRDIAGLVSMLGIHKADASGKASVRLGMMAREPVPELIEVVRTSSNPHQRHAAATLLALLCAGSSPQQEKFAHRALAIRVGWAAMPEVLPADLRALPVFAKAVVNDKFHRVREVSAQGLGYLGDASAATPLAEALSDPVAAVRRRAAAALITVPAKQAQGALEDALRRDKSAAVRRYAAEALGWIGDSSVIPALLDAAGDPAAEVRHYAAIQLGRMRDPRALQALAKLFQDEDEDVRWAAVVAVGKLRAPEATPYLVAVVDDPSPMVSHAAERALQKMGIRERKAPEFEK